MNTEGLDPITAKAVDLLMAADLVAAEQRLSSQREVVTTTTVSNGRRWRDPAFYALIAGLVCLVLLSFDNRKITAQSANIHRLQQQNHYLLTQIDSCLNPKGVCARQSARHTEDAVEQIVRRVVAATCAEQVHASPGRIRHCVKVSQAAAEAATRH